MPNVTQIYIQQYLTEVNYKMERIKNIDNNYFFENYKDIVKSQKASPRSIIRHIALDFAALIFSLINKRQIPKTPRIQFLYIHHIFKDEEASLIQLLQYLQKDHVFISYSDAVRRICNDDIDAPYICLSSDDGFKNNLSAAKIFQQFGISACFFINPEFTTNAESFEKTKTNCISKLSLPPVEFMNWNDVNSLIEMGHEIGAHTLSHDNLANISDADFELDCLKSIEQIRQNCKEVKHFAWPYGRFFHFSESKQNIVFNVGFESCASAERGCHLGLKTNNYKDLILRRDHIVLNWPLRHIEYFLMRNAMKMQEQNNYFPNVSK